MRGRAGLPLELGLGELQRFHLPHLLRIDGRLRAAARAGAPLHVLPCAPGSALPRRPVLLPNHPYVHDTSLERMQIEMIRRDDKMTWSFARVLELFHPAVAEWFRASFEAPTPPQTQGWPAIARGESTLILAPTGSGKTLTAFLWCLNRLMFEPAPAEATALPRALHLAAQGARGRRRAQPARAARRHRQPRRGARRRRSRCRRSRSAPATRRRPSARASCASRPTS